jgi:hypothetical protein
MAALDINARKSAALDINARKSAALDINARKSAALDIKRCLSVPSKGGMSVEQVRQIAASLGLDTSGTKAVLCDKINNFLSSGIAAPIPIPVIVPVPNPVVSPKVSARTVVPQPSVEGNLDTKSRAPLINQMMPIPRKPAKPLPPIPTRAGSDATINKLYQELDDLLESNSQKLHCCVEQYETEIARAPKKVGKALRSIKSALLDKFYAKYQDMYYEYFLILKQSGRERANQVLLKRVPELYEYYTILTRQALNSVPLKDLQYLFPPNYMNFDFYDEDRNKVCQKYPSTGANTLPCFRTYMMQFMLRLVLLAKTIESEKRKNKLAITGTDVRMLETFEREAGRLSDLQKFIDGLLLCRKDYCDPKNCQKKKQFIGSTCVPLF